MTDITGFGLIGHARELALAGNVSLRLSAGEIPPLPGALDCIRAGYIPAGLNNNRDFAECVVGYEAPISAELKALLFDPQTAGGLLISVASAESQPLILELQNAGVPARRIGNVIESQKPLISIY
jgi:selenide,water dikinase